MECYYHPGRESSDNCAICGKSICKECGLEIAGKTYCKECLEKIVGLGIENNTAPQAETIESTRYAHDEPARLNKRPIAETIYETQNNEIPYTSPENNGIRQINDESPYNIHHSNDNYAPQREEPEIVPQPQIAQNEYDIYPNAEKEINNTQEYIYPDHSYESVNSNLEDKYEKYLDDLYFDENEIPLNEQLAKDEAEYGSLTRRPYQPRSEEALLREKEAQRPKQETPEEMEARIRAEILAEKNGKKGIRDSNIHNLNYKEEKEPMNIVDILLTVILVIVVLIVIYYILYVFILNTSYPTFMDAIYGLTNPQNVINNILNPVQ